MSTNQFINRNWFCVSVWLVSILLIIVCFNIGQASAKPETIVIPDSVHTAVLYEDITVTPEEDVIEEVKPVQVVTEQCVATAYCPCSICCGKWADGKTASGTIATQGRTIAVDKSIIPLGEIVTVNGKDYIAEDTGSAIKGKKIDIFFDSHNDALEFGRKEVEVSY